MNKDLIKGLLILGGVVVALTVGAFMLSEHGGQKAKCIARAIGSGVALSSIGQVCGL